MSFFTRRRAATKAALLYHREARERYDAQRLGFQYDSLVRWYIEGVRLRRNTILRNLGGSS